MYLKYPSRQSSKDCATRVDRGLGLGMRAPYRKFASGPGDTRADSALRAYLECIMSPTEGTVCVAILHTMICEYDWRCLETSFLSLQIVTAALF